MTRGRWPQRSTRRAPRKNGRIPGNPAQNRRILWFAIGCAGLLTCHILALLPARWNKQASNLVFVAESAFAIICLHAARKRAEGVARTYWLLFTLAVVVFGVASAIWAAEATLQVPGPLQHALLFFYRLYAAPLAMTLVLRRYQGGVGLTREAALDFLQVGIVGWLIFLALFYLPAQNLSLSDARFLSVIQIGNAINLLLLIGVVIRWRTESDLVLRGLRGRLAGFVGLYATVAASGSMPSASPVLHAGSTWPGPRHIWRRQLWRRVEKHPPRARQRPSSPGRWRV